MLKKHYLWHYRIENAISQKIKKVKNKLILALATGEKSYGTFFGEEEVHHLLIMNLRINK